VKLHTRLGLVVTLCAAATVPLYAQAQRDTAQARQDSLEERLEKAEEAIQRLQHEVESQAQSSVQSRLQNRVEISGLILVNGFYDGAKFNDTDVPEWVAAVQDTTGRPNSRIGGTMRQARLGITVRPGKVLGGDVSADLQLDFFGGQEGDANDRLLSPPRIRTGNVRVDWPHFGVLVGQEKALVAPESPVSFAAIGYPEFAGAGNLWNWIPQARVTAEAGRSLRVGIQAAALDPLWDPGASYAPSDADLGERSGRPAVEGRAYLDWGSDENESTIGFGAHRGWIATAGTGTIASQALTADFHLVFAGVVTLAGSAFTGQVLNMLGDGAISQDIGPLGQVVRTRGGWAQLDVRPVFAWEFGGGYGRDAPTPGDLEQAGGTFPANARLRNVVYEGHVHWRPGGGLLIGAEFRRFETEFPAGVLKANHVNGFVGLFF